MSKLMPQSEYVEVKKQVQKDIDADKYIGISNIEKYARTRLVALKLYKSISRSKAKIYISNVFIPSDNDFIWTDALCNHNIKQICKTY